MLEQLQQHVKICFVAAN